ncbi:MAG: tRNA 4-thiouridine(8) synthase ThiI [Chloroflexi bacterium]|nr:tRNA 4-thiouridine(8) synthase ThiI [Chloroflexota bacterium]
MARYVIAHYHEVALKGKNRPFFVDRLVANTRRALAEAGLRRASAVYNSILVELDDQAPWEVVQAGLQRVFGLANFARVERCPLELEAIKAAVQRVVEASTFHTFRISARRGDKRFAMTSDELNRELGAFVQSFTRAPVSLKQPDLTVYVEVLAREALVYGEKIAGPGGLPVGSGGRVAALLSGGIDSPVAAYRMLRRGCTVSFIHFHGYPFLDASSKQKAQELVELLDGYQGSSRLYLVPFGEVQRQVVLDAPEPYRTVIYRRLMVRLAGHIARTEGALALVTGDSLGQVASQTLENLAAVDAAAELPLLRPLIGMDKLEIIRQAEQIGTYPISIVADQDCCQLFMPRHPTTHATAAEMLQAEQHLDFDQLARFALDEVEVIDHGRGGRRKERRSLVPVGAGASAITPGGDG